MTPRRERRHDEEKTASKKTTSIYFPADLLTLLRRVAFERAEQTGRGFSVSALVVELVERHRGELNAEYKRAQKTP